MNNPNISNGFTPRIARMNKQKSKTPTAAWIETPTACYLVGATLPITVESEADYDQRMADREQDRYEQQES